MTIYLVYMASPVFLYLLMRIFYTGSINENKKVRNAYLFLFAIIMILMIGLRSRYVGSGDTNFYYNNWILMSRVEFSQLNYTLESIDLEKGYLISVWILSHIFEDPQMLLVLSAAFFAITLCSFVEKNCDDVVLALLVFNCLGLFNFMIQGLRQSIAMCICLFALEKCKKNQIYRFVILILIAMSFHASAVVFAVVYLLRYFKLTFPNILIFFTTAIIGINLLPYIFNFMNSLLNDEYSLNTEAEKGGVVAILIYLLIIIFSLLTKKENDKYFSIFIYMSLIGVSTLLMRNTVSNIAERVGFFFAFSQVALVSNGVQALNDKITRAVVVIIVALLCFGVAIYKASYSIVIPYEFYWQV